MKRIVFGILIVFVLSCGAPRKDIDNITATSPSTTTLEESATKLTQTPIQAGPEGWQEIWERDIAQAKKEKKLVIYTGIDPQTREPLSKAFKERFGIDAEWIVGRGGELGERMLRENRAGLNQGDMYIGGSTTAITVLKPANTFIPLEPWLVLPEVKDNKYWFEGSLPFADKDRLLITFLIYLNQNIAINNSLVKPGEIKSYKDFLNPKWKDKILLNDPTIPGSAGRWAIMVGHYIPDLGWDFHRALAKQNPTLMRDERLMAEWLARGKFPILIGVERQVRDFKELGAPVDLQVLKEGNYGASGYGNVALLRNAPHPGAAKVFVNWLLSKEGQTIVTTSQVKQSARLDVPTGHLQKDQIREELIKSGGKFLNPPDEEFMEVNARYSSTVKDIYGPLAGK